MSEQQLAFHRLNDTILKLKENKQRVTADLLEDKQTQNAVQQEMRQLQMEVAFRKSNVADRNRQISDI